MFSRSASSSVPDGLRYRAFLSYRSSDRKEAEWLHRKLESYRIPRRLVGKPSTNGIVPARLAPIFRDRDDARSADDLETIIAASLARSQQLIVLCTPSAASPESWVGREIEIFRRERPVGEIHAVIARGVPPACFPQPLLSRTSSGELRAPLAADLRPPGRGGDGRKKALIKLVAGLAGVEFDDLWRRERRRTLIRASIAALLVMTLLIAGGVWLAQRENARLAAIEKASRQVDRRLNGDAADLMLIAAGPPVWGAAISPDPKQVESVRAIARRLEPSFAGFATHLHNSTADETTIAFSDDGRFVFKHGGQKGIFVWDVARNRLAARLPVSKSDWLRLPLPKEREAEQYPIALDIARNGRCVLAVYAHGKENERIAAQWQLDANGSCSAPCLPTTFPFVLPSGGYDWHKRLGSGETAQLRLFPDLRKAMCVEIHRPPYVLDLTRRAAIPIISSVRGACSVEIPRVEPSFAAAESPFRSEPAYPDSPVEPVWFEERGRVAARKLDERTIVFYSGTDVRELAHVRIPPGYFPAVFLNDGQRALIVNTEGDPAGVLDLGRCQFDAWPPTAIQPLRRMRAALGSEWVVYSLTSFRVTPERKHVAGLMTLSNVRSYSTQHSVAIIYGIDERRVTLVAPLPLNDKLARIDDIALGDSEFAFLLITNRGLLPIKSDGTSGPLNRYGEERVPWFENVGQPVLLRNLRGGLKEWFQLRVIDRRTHQTGPALDYIADKISSAAVSDDGKMLALAQDPFVFIEPANDRAIPDARRLMFEKAQRVLFSPDGRWLGASTDSKDSTGTMQVWNVADGSAAGRCVVPPNSRLLAVGNDGSVIFTAPEGLTQLEVRTGKSHLILHASPPQIVRNGARLLTADNGGHVWQLDTGSEAKRWKDIEFLKDKWLMGLSADGRTAYAINFREDGFFLNLETGTSEQFLGRGFPGTFAFAADGRFAIVVTPPREIDANDPFAMMRSRGGDDEIQLWDSSRSSPISLYRSDWKHVLAIWFSADGHELRALDDGGRLHRWNLATDYTSDVAGACVALRDSGARLELADADLAQEPHLEPADKAPCLRVGPLSRDYYTSLARRVFGVVVPSDCAKEVTPAKVKRCMEPFDRRWRRLEELAAIRRLHASW